MTNLVLDYALYWIEQIHGLPTLSSSGSCVQAMTLEVGSDKPIRFTNQSEDSKTKPAKKKTK